MSSAEGKAPMAAVAGDPGCLDYGLSFVCHTAAFNAVRFWVESRTLLLEPGGGAPVEFLQCASCKSENTFAEKDLFHPENYDFLPIVGEGHWLVFRRPAALSERYRSLRPVGGMWGEPVLKLRRAAEVTLLDTWEKVRDATAEALPLVSQTRLTDAQTGRVALIECPMKTMNISLERRMYQVDTGPVALPDLTRSYEPRVDCLKLAFIAFNAPDFADFVVEQPTPVMQDGQEVCRVHHYSNPISLPAENRLLSIGSVAK